MEGDHGMTVPKVQTTFIAGERWYIDNEGTKAPGMSSILGMMPKPALTKWAAREAAAFAVHNIEMVAILAKTDKQAAIELVKGAPWRKSGKAADLGTEVHGLTETLMRDRMLGRKSDFRVPAGGMDFLRNFARFISEFQVRPVAVETTIWNDVVGYAGTFDGIYELTMPEELPAPWWLESHQRYALPGETITAMVDTKTGESGVWPEAALQQTGYSRAPWYIHESTGAKTPMFQVDAAAGLWLRPEGWALIPLAIDDLNFEQVIRLRESFEWKRSREKHAVGKAVNVNPHKRKWKGNA